MKPYPFDYVKQEGPNNLLLDSLKIIGTVSLGYLLLALSVIYSDQIDRFGEVVNQFFTNLIGNLL